jgi:hypothetical protein
MLYETRSDYKGSILGSPFVSSSNECLSSHFQNGVVVMSKVDTTEGAEAESIDLAFMGMALILALMG